LELVLFVHPLFGGTHELNKTNGKKINTQQIMNKFMASNEFSKINK
jgi:hypothetical protein